MLSYIIIINNIQLTCYVGGQIDGVTESSTVLQDTNLQFTENEKFRISYRCSKKAKCGTANLRRTPIQMAAFLLFQSPLIVNIFFEHCTCQFFAICFSSDYISNNITGIYSCIVDFYLNSKRHLDGFRHYSV